MRILGAIVALVVTEFFFHIINVFAMGLKAETQAERIGAVVFGVVILVILMFIFRKLFSPSFFHGFVVATGLFLSFDIVVFHWIFQLHRITSGPEANWLEPILIVSGTLFVWYGIKKENKLQNRSINLK